VNKDLETGEKDGGGEDACGQDVAHVRKMSSLKLTWCFPMHTMLSAKAAPEGEEEGGGEGGASGRHFSHPRRARRNTLAWSQLVEPVQGKRRTPNALSSRQEVVVNLRMS